MICPSWPTARAHDWVRVRTDTRREALQVAVREAEGGVVDVFCCAADGLDTTFPGAQWCDRRRDVPAPVVFHVATRYYESWLGRDHICLACGETTRNGDA